MVNLLRKIFIKDYTNIKDPKIREKHSVLAGIVGIVMNLILAVLKIIIGLISGSGAIIGDSLNNFSDTINGIITIVGAKMSQKPADDEHPFGHGRIEQIAGLTISIIILFLGLILFKESIDSIIDQNVVHYSNTVIIILAISIIIKLVQGIFYLKMYHIIDNIALRANGFDSFSDILSTLVILIGVVVSTFNPDILLDGYLGIFVAMIIILNAVRFIRDSSKELLGGNLDKEQINSALNKIEQYSDKFLGIHDVMAHSYGAGKVFLIVHLEVSQFESFMDMHNLSDEIEEIIKKEYNINLVIHLDPINNRDPLTLQIKEEIMVKLKSLDDSLQCHDLRVFKKKDDINIVFDLEHKRNCKFEPKEIEDILEELFKERKEKYDITVRYVDTYYIRG